MTCQIFRNKVLFSVDTTKALFAIIARSCVSNNQPHELLGELIDLKI